MKMYRSITPPTRRHALAAVLCIVAVLVGCVDDTSVATPREPMGFGDPVPAVGGLPRLTSAQYRNAIGELFGPTVLVPTNLEPDLPAEGSVVLGASTHAISPVGVERYEGAAYAIAEQVMAEGDVRDVLVTCAPSAPGDAACATEVMGPLMRRAYRRAVTDAEVQSVVAVAVNAGATLGDFYDGLEYGIAALLMSPDFLYRPALGDDAPNGGALSSFELASRLSFFLWDTVPDEALLSAAEEERLIGGDLEAQVDRMLADPRVRQGMRAFVSDWLGLDRLSDLSKDPTIFRAASPELGPAAREETLRFFEHLFLTTEAPLSEMLTSRTTFVNRRLSAIYEIPAPTADGFGMVTLPESDERRGLLGQVSVLALHAHAVSTSPTLRGRFIRETLLCTTVPAPPVNVETSIPEPSTEARTLRERLASHRSVSFCASCHGLLDPIGLGLESYDGIGRHRTLDNDFPIDTTGDLDGRPYADMLELTAALSRHPNLRPCFVRRVFRYATGGPDDERDLAAIAELLAQFGASGDRYRALLRAIALSPAFSAARASEEEMP
jgi:hypothetical protein